MSVVDDYVFFEDVYDKVQAEHDRLTSLGMVGFVSAFPFQNDVFTTICDSVVDARTTIDALADGSGHFYVIGADIRE